MVLLALYHGWWWAPLWDEFVILGLPVLCSLSKVPHPMGEYGPSSDNSVFWAYSSPNPKSLYVQFSPFLHGSRHIVSVLYNGLARVSAKNTEILRSTWDIIPNGILLGSAIFFTSNPWSSSAFQWAGHPKSSSFHGGIWTPCNTWFFRHASHQPSGTSISWAIFSGLMVFTSTQTDRQTDRQTMQ